MRLTFPLFIFVLEAEADDLMRKSDFFCSHRHKVLSHRHNVCLWLNCSTLCALKVVGSSPFWSVVGQKIKDKSAWKESFLHLCWWSRIRHMLESVKSSGSKPIFYY